MGTPSDVNVNSCHPVLFPLQNQERGCFLCHCEVIVSVCIVNNGHEVDNNEDYNRSDSNNITIWKIAHRLSFFPH